MNLLSLDSKRVPMRVLNCVAFGNELIHGKVHTVLVEDDALYKT